MLLTLLSCYKLNRCYIKLSLVNILEMVFVFIEILFKMFLFKGGVLIYPEHCICVCVCVCVSIVTGRKNHPTRRAQTNTLEGGFIQIERVQSEEWLAEEVRCSPWVISLVR